MEHLLDLLPTADIVVLIVPQTPETRGMIGEREFTQMKQGALLVNAARGPVVHRGDAGFFGNGRIRAALDVTEPEPLPAEHPLWSAPNIFITPHVAASSPCFCPVPSHLQQNKSRAMKGRATQKCCQRELLNPDAAPFFPPTPWERFTLGIAHPQTAVAA